MVEEGFVHYNIAKWINENERYFLPPVCNKMMHGDGQLKVFYVGGPNTRKDFHLEEGEELFYMKKGDMTLVTMVGGAFKEVVIKEGQVFLLPGKIPHSPQRYEDTIGLVIERERAKDSEFDCLRYFVQDSTEILFEKWFYCRDLGTQLVPVIKEFLASEEHKTGKPKPGSITENPPWTPDSDRKLEEPFDLQAWLKSHKKEIDEKGSRRLFDTSYQSDIVIYGKGVDNDRRHEGSEVWLWQLEGTCEVKIGKKSVTLNPDDTLLVKESTTFSHVRPEGSLTMSVLMDFREKSRGFAHLKN